MAKILIAGHINIETTLKVDGFPIEYHPVRYPFHGINTTISGVGFNVAKALTTLGHDVTLLSLIGNDMNGALVKATLEDAGIDTTYVLRELDATCQSVILFDDSGQRLINTDLKDIQARDYLLKQYEKAIQGQDLAILCNINFSRHLLTRTRTFGIPIATDVHTIRSLDDDYNRDYMSQADIVFMSHENLPMSPDDWARTFIDTFDTPKILGIGLGVEGALLATRTDIHHVPTHITRPVVNTIGGGDALFSSFIHGYLTYDTPLIAMQYATLFASYKVGANGGAEGFLLSEELESLYKRVLQG